MINAFPAIVTRRQQLAVLVQPIPLLGNRTGLTRTLRHDVADDLPFAIHQGDADLTVLGQRIGKTQRLRLHRRLRSGSAVHLRHRFRQIPPRGEDCLTPTIAALEREAGRRHQVHRPSAATRGETIRRAPLNLNGGGDVIAGFRWNLRFQRAPGNAVLEGATLFVRRHHIGSLKFLRGHRAAGVASFGWREIHAIR